MTELFQLIEKEDVKYCIFPKEDVLDDDELIEDRKQIMNRALSLGNHEKIKVKIYFEDKERKKKVITTIWGITDSRIILKQGVVIPIHRIHRVRIHE
ncbi:MAG: hypothetical protein H6584_00125 [Flavobacteriales bacterium]|nr:hypothetical protein [Flavobacteriales bacterium]